MNGATYAMSYKKFPGLQPDNYGRLSIFKAANCLALSKNAAAWDDENCEIELNPLCKHRAI